MSHPILRVALRESLVLLAATGFSWFIMQMNPFLGFNTKPLGFILPFLYCLGRLALLEYPPPEFPWLRRTGFQIAMGIGLVCLLLFEEMIALMQLQGSKNGWEVWTTLTGFGMSYVFCFCVADALRRPPRERNSSVPSWEPRTWGQEEESQNSHEPPRRYHV